MDTKQISAWVTGTCTVSQHGASVCQMLMHHSECTLWRCCLAFCKEVAVSWSLHQSCMWCNKMKSWSHDRQVIKMTAEQSSFSENHLIAFQETSGGDTGPLYPLHQVQGRIQTRLSTLGYLQHTLILPPHHGGVGWNPASGVFIFHFLVVVHKMCYMTLEPTTSDHRRHHQQCSPPTALQWWWVWIAGMFIFLFWVAECTFRPTEQDSNPPPVRFQERAAAP